jgi:UDP-glucose 4-epimerase
MSQVISWVVGRGGLLGGAVETAIAKQGQVWHPPFDINWSEFRLAQDQLQSACRSFAETSGPSSWQIAWCAGPGISTTSSRSLTQETQHITLLLNEIARAFGPTRLQSGALFLSSSAGGVYGASPAAPHDEGSLLLPATPYGFNKVAQESLVSRWNRETGVPVLIGRISNLYGPRQNPFKGQGLITQVCLHTLTRRPLILRVPMDTIRDYIYAEDAGCLISRALTRLRDEQASHSVVVKIVASHRPVTIGYIFAQVRLVLKRPLTVLVANAAETKQEPRDLRLVSTIWADLDRCQTTSLPEGIRTVVNGLMVMTSRGRFAMQAFATGGPRSAD